MNDAANDQICLLHQPQIKLSDDADHMDVVGVDDLVWVRIGVFSDELARVPYDIVLSNGRVIDPETKLDAIRNVGIKKGKITRPV